MKIIIIFICVKVERLSNAHQIEKKIECDWNLNTEQNKKDEGI
jgi:hypothetical protein